MPVRAVTQRHCDPIIDSYRARINKIPLLSHEETLELSRQIAECDDEALRQRLIKKFVESNLRLVVKIALGYNRAPVDLMDLVQEGNQGLMRAIEKFDYRRDIQFSTYAGWWIRAFIWRYIVDNRTTVRMPARFQDKIRQLSRLIAESRASTGKYPDIDELGAELGLGLEQVRSLMNDEVKMVDSSPFREGERVALVESLPAPEDRSADEGLYEQDLAALPWEIHEKAMSACHNRKMKIAMIRSFQAFLMYYFHEMTLQEIGEHFGVTRERARQLRDKFFKRYAIEARRRHCESDLVN